MPDHLSAPPAPLNTGLDLARQIREESTEDRVFGALSPASLVSIPEKERDEYLPIGEVQFSSFSDFMDCASRSPINHLEALFTYHYRTKMKAENKAWLEAQGYIKDGRVTFSDRFVAVLSGTTKNGNSLKAPLQAIHSQGLIPKAMLPKEEWMTFEDYHDKRKITPAMKALGLEFLKRFKLNYEQVRKVHFADVLKDDMIGVAAHAWPLPINGIFPKTDEELNHAFILYKLPQYQAYDNYYDYTDQGQQILGDFTKNLSPDYQFFDYGYRMIVTSETTNEELSIEELVKQTLKKYNLLSFFSRWLSLFTAPKPEPPPPPPPPVPANNLLNTFCLEVKRHEGWAVPGQTLGGVLYPKGSLSYRCNNPGNARFFAGGYMPVYGEVTEYREGLTLKPGQRGFAKFKTYELGYLYLKNLVLSKIKAHPNWNFYDFFGDPKEGWAPNSDNNDSARYAYVVAKACGLLPSSRVSNIL